MRENFLDIPVKEVGEGVIDRRRRSRGSLPRF